MNMNSKVIASIVGGLLMLLLSLPMLVGGTQGMLFWALFGVLALGLAVALTYLITNRRQQR
jgi:hypothetical protein